MEQRERGDEGHPGSRRSDTWRTRSDRELIVAMRAGASAAFDEFVARYEPLLRYRSRHMQLAEWERDDCVADTLESVVVHLLKPNVRAPAKMAAYLTRALYNELTDARRALQARVSREEDAVDWSDRARDRAVTSVVSEYTVHACLPADTARLQLAPGLERLAAALVQPLSDDERLLIGWEGSMIPHRTIAEWLGISRGAATKRIWRLRERLRGLATAHIRSLAPTERSEVGRFVLRRFEEDEGRKARVAAESTRSPQRPGDDINASPAREGHSDD